MLGPPILLLAGVLAPPQAAPRQAASLACNPAQPPESMEAYFTRQDYPPTAVRDHEQGIVDFCLVINASGRVSSCTIVHSSGFADLDVATCRIVYSRYRSRSGAAAMLGRVRWTLPGA